MVKKKTRAKSRKIQGRCLEADAQRQTISEGFAMLDEPILNPREALAYQWSLRRLALDNVRIKSESSRDSIDQGTAYYSEGAVQIKAHILSGIATDVHFASDEPDASIDRIMLSFVKVFNEKKRRWLPVDSHIWLFVNKITIRDGEGWEDRPEGEIVGIALGDRVVIMAADHLYDGPRGMRRHGVSEWSIVSSSLLYVMHDRRGRRVVEVPRAIVKDAYLMFLMKRDGKVGVALMDRSDWEGCQKRCRSAAERERWSLAAFMERA